MVILKIKLILSSEKPKSSKVSTESDAVKRFEIELDSWQNVFQKLNEHAKQLFSLADTDSSLYWIDEDDDLIKLSKDDHVKTAYESIKRSSNLKLFLVKNAFDDFKRIKESFNDIQYVPDVAKNKQTHRGVICDNCKNQIIGIRYASKDIDNYDLCEDCFYKTNQTYQSYVPIYTMYGFYLCCDCFKEIKTGSVNKCFTCKNEKVPELNKTIKNESIKFLIWEVCDRCKEERHKMHSFASESILDIYKANKILQNEIKANLNKGEEIKLNFDCGLCHNCNRNGVSLRCTSNSFEHVLLCTDCFLGDSLLNIAKFRLLLDEEADYLRKKRQNNNEQIANLELIAFQARQQSAQNVIESNRILQWQMAKMANNIRI